MPDNNEYYPALSNLIGVDDLPESLSFIQDGLDKVLDNVYYQNFISSVSIDGSGAFYSLDIVSKKRLAFELFGSGISFILNPDYDNSSISSFPITLFWEWKILKYFRNFKLGNFSFKPEAFFDFAITILGISEEETLKLAIATFVVSVDPTTSSFAQLVADINFLYGSNIVIDESDEDKFEQLILQVELLDKDVFVTIFSLYLLGDSLQDTKQKLNYFFASFIPTDLETYVKDLFIPKVRASLTLSAAIEFPRNVLTPMKQTPDGLVPDETLDAGGNLKKSYFQFVEADFEFDTEAGIGTNVFLEGSLLPAEPVVHEIGNTIYFPVDVNYPYRLRTLFSLVGFARNANNGTFTFSAKPNNLAKITEYIIEELIMFKSFKDRALHTWIQQANDIRAMQGIELERLNEIAVYNSTNEDGNKLLNSKPQNTRRFLEITTAPSMPIITIVNYSNTAIKVRIKIEFIKPMQGNQVRKFLDYFPADTAGHTINTKSSWLVNFEGKIRGGTATIEYVNSNESWNNKNTFVFYIRGKNPSYQELMQYLSIPKTPGQPNTSYINKYWFLARMIIHESLSENLPEVKQFNYSTAVYSTTKHSSKGLPNLGAPRGFGLGQIDNSGKVSDAYAESHGIDLASLKNGANKYRAMPDDNGNYIAWLLDVNDTKEMKLFKVATDQGVWHWKENLERMYIVLDGKLADALAYLNQNAETDRNKYPIRRKMQDWNSAHPNDKIILPQDIIYESGDKKIKITYRWVKSDIPVFDKPELNALFSQDQVSTDTVKSFFDAEVMRLYNGGHFLKLSNPINNKPVFSIDTENALGFNYVERVTIAKLSNQ